MRTIRNVVTAGMLAGATLLMMTEPVSALAYCGCTEHRPSGSFWHYCIDQVEGYICDAYPVGGGVAYATCCFSGGTEIAGAGYCQIGPVECGG